MYDNKHGHHVDQFVQHLLLSFMSLEAEERKAVANNK